MDCTLNCGEFKVTGAPGVSSITGPDPTSKVIDFHGGENFKVDGGDSGSGMWDMTTVPPSVVALVSGAKDCALNDELCQSGDGKDILSSGQSVELGIINGALRYAPDFVAAAELNNIATSAGNLGGQFGVYHFGIDGSAVTKFQYIDAL